MSIFRKETSTDWLLTVCIFTSVFCGCGKNEEASRRQAQIGDTPLVLTAWAHHGKPQEWRTIQEQVARFNESQDDVRVELVEIAEGDYDTQVQSAAVTGSLPEILEFDGPMLANYVWKGYLQPLEDVISIKTRSLLLPSIIEQGTFEGNLYSVGAFDSGLALYGNLKLLQAVDARIPDRVENAWSATEFSNILEKLSARNKKDKKPGYALDIKRDYRGEWWTYGFYPTLASGGAGLIETNHCQSANGVLNSRAAVNVLKNFQNWMQGGYIAPNTDGRAFIEERVALSWVGHWEYPRYKKAIDNLY